MKEVDISLDLLNKILVEDVTFQEALRNKFVKDVSDRPYRSTVASFVGCVLRHEILFSYYLKNLDDLENDERFFIYIVLANEYFTKKVSFENLEPLIKEKVKQNHMDLLNELLAKKDKPETFVPENIRKNSLTYLSLRFNTPEWILKIWKHFGFSTVYKMLKKYSKPGTLTVRLRNSAILTSSMLTDSSFAETCVPEIFYYKGKESIRKNGFYVRDEIFNEKPGLKSVLDKFYIESDNAEILAFNGNSSSSLDLELIESYGERIGINLGVYSLNNHPDITKAIRTANLKNINYFAANPLEMVSHISNPQDLVIVHPDSTNFDLIKDNPDYFYHFKKENIDEIIQKQADMLEGCSKFVADQGDLLYIVTTVSKKECGVQIAEFIKKHPDFNLVEEKQMFCFDSTETSLYYAKLHKGMPVAKDDISPTILSEQIVSTSFVASAEASD